jgi:maleamate amidohydrolase
MSNRTPLDQVTETAEMEEPGRSASDLSADYDRAGFQGQLGFGTSPALVIIDMARAYFNPSSPLYAGVESALESTIRVLEAARSARIPIIFTEVKYRVGGADGGVFFRKVSALKCFEEGNPLRELQPPLRVLPNELVVTKQYASAFFGTSLAATLTALRVDTLLITGVSTSGCVRATGLDACQNGFIPIVIREAVGDRDERVHEANLFDLNAKYADVVGESEALAYLRQHAY